MSQLFSANITNGNSISGGIAIGNNVISGIVMPAAWTAAVLTFQVSVDDGASFKDLYDSAGNEVSFTVAASRFVAVDPTLWIGVNYVKVRSGTSGSPVSQGADRLISLIGSQ